MLFHNLKGTDLRLAKPDVLHKEESQDIGSTEDRDCEEERRHLTLPVILSVIKEGSRLLEKSFAARQTHQSESW